jgi:hypothetical protein
MNLNPKEPSREGSLGKRKKYEMAGEKWKNQP